MKIYSYLQWFCVANGIFALEANIVYIGALVKKLRNCLRIVTGNLIDRNSVDKEVGYVDVL